MFYSCYHCVLCDKCNIIIIFDAVYCVASEIVIFFILAKTVCETSVRFSLLQV